MCGLIRGEALRAWPISPTAARAASSSSNLASGNSWRHLDHHPSVKPAPDLQQTTEGEPFIQRKPTGEQASPDMRSDGIALSPDGSTLYYTPLASHDVYAVPTQLLADR